MRLRMQHVETLHLVEWKRVVCAVQSLECDFGLRDISIDAETWVNPLGVFRGEEKGWRSYPFSTFGLASDERRA